MTAPQVLLADRPPTTSRVEVLQHFRAQAAGRVLRLGRPAERLIAYLAVERRSRTREYLAGCLWSESTQARASGNLRRALSLIEVAAPGLILREGHALSLSPGLWVDFWVQRALIDRIVGGERCSADNEELALLRGDLLPDWDDAWLTPVREEVRQLRLLSLEAVAITRLDDDRPDAALAVALCAALDEPLRESAHRLVVQAHLALGNQAAAALHYTDYRRVLWNELRLRPGARMDSLVRPVLNGRFVD